MQQKHTQVDLKQLYRRWPEVKSMLKSIGCRGQQAEDIFQESLLILVRKCDDPHFVLDVEPMSYVKQVARFMWYNEARKTAKNPTFSLETDWTDEEVSWMEKEAKLKHVEQVLQKLGEQCRTILELFYGKGLAMIEIAKKVGLRNDKVVKAQKYRCLTKAKVLVAEFPEEFND